MMEQPKFFLFEGRSTYPFAMFSDFQRAKDMADEKARFDVSIYVFESDKIVYEALSLQARNGTKRRVKIVEIFDPKWNFLKTMRWMINSFLDHLIDEFLLP